MDGVRVWTVMKEKLLVRTQSRRDRWLHPFSNVLFWSEKKESGTMDEWALCELLLYKLMSFTDRERGGGGGDEESVLRCHKEEEEEEDEPR